MRGLVQYEGIVWSHDLRPWHGRMLRGKATRGWDDTGKHGRGLVGMVCMEDEMGWEDAGRKGKVASFFVCTMENTGLLILAVTMHLGRVGLGRVGIIPAGAVLPIELCKSEVDDLDLHRILDHEDVLWLQVSVYHLLIGVQVTKHVHQLLGDLHSLLCFTQQHHKTLHATTQHSADATTAPHPTTPHHTLSTPQLYPRAGCRVRSPGRQGPGTANRRCTNSVGCAHVPVPSTIPRDPAAPSTGRLGPGNGQRPPVEDG